jgi:hypothetical protein
MNTIARFTAVLLTALFAVLFVSCPALLEAEKDPLDTLEDGSFYAQNMETGKYYKVKADMLYEGTQCVIWAEKGAGVTQAMAQTIAREYDTVIRPKVMNAFTGENITIHGMDIIYSFDMLDYANWLAGRDDRKLTILLLDIKDGYKSKKDSYVAGYFFSGNFFSPGKIPETVHYSNSRDMIYVDTYPGLSDQPEQTYATFAHELQHLINFVTTIQTGREYLMDTWIDEGLSSQAEYLYLGENPIDRYGWFSEDPAGTIAKGNNFFVWGNDTGNPLSILDEYATVYLFFRWLYLQAGTSPGLQDKLFYEIITSDNSDYQAITNVAREIKSEWSNWSSLLRTWFAANCYPENSYGYTGDNVLREHIKIKPIGGSTIQLYPGEGVYSIINNNSFNPGLPPINISYAGLSANGGIETSPASYTGNFLLTFNTSTANSGKIKTDTGSLTGVTPLSSSVRMIGGIQSGITGPYVIDARDMGGRIREDDRTFLQTFRNTR